MLDSKFTCKGTLPPQLGICWDSQHHPGCLLRVPNRQAVHCKAVANPLPDTGSNIVRAQGIEVTMQEWGGVLRSCTTILLPQTDRTLSNLSGLLLMKPMEHSESHTIFSRLLDTNFLNMSIQMTLGRHCIFCGHPCPRGYWGSRSRDQVVPASRILLGAAYLSRREIGLR